MQRGWRFLVVTVVAVLFGLLLWNARSVGAAAQVGDPAPNFTLPRLQGGSLQLSAQRGKIVVLNFWTTWCDACKEEMPELEAFANAHRQSVVVIGIDRREPAGFVAPFVKQLGVTYPVVLDQNDDMAKRYGVTGVPETFIIDRNGRIRAHVWSVTRQALEQAYAALGGE